MVDWLELAGYYSLMPNCLGYCGGSTFAGVFSDYRCGKVSAGRLKAEIRKFKGEYAYLKTIARANRINDPFDHRVLEAFWHGNSLLKKIKREDVVQMIENFVETAGMNKKRAERKLSELKRLKTVPSINHDFNSLFINFVGNKVPRRTRNYDKCRIAYGTIVSFTQKTARVRYPPLVRVDKNKFTEGKFRVRLFKRTMHGICPEPNLKVGDKVSLHWGRVICKIPYSRTD